MAWSGENGSTQRDAPVQATSSRTMRQLVRAKLSNTAAAPFRLLGRTVVPLFRTPLCPPSTARRLPPRVLRILRSDRDIKV